MPAATTSANLAAHTFSVSRSEGYSLPSYSVDITLGSVLGADHVAWVVEGPTPAATAHGLGLDAADANLLDMAAAYLELAHILS